MKSSKNTRQQYGNSERKSGKRSEKAAKLDRKSSRGMIYENEELRLRTININAEVERGQSDIKRLRRENEHLRREIWTLRDECDRLNKRFKAKIPEPDHGGSNARGSGGSGGGCPRGCDGVHSHSNSDDSDSCDTCRGDDDHCSDDCCRDGSCNQMPSKQDVVDMSRVSASSNSQQNTSSAANATSASGATYDHLSVVSEETMSNSEMLAPHNEHLLGYMPDTVHGSQTTLPSLVGPLTPLTPIEMVANQLNDLQAVVPPLSYFENILSQHMGSNIGNTPESSTTTTSTGGTVNHTNGSNGWDYNLQSPFSQRKCPTSSSYETSTTSRSSPLPPQRYAAQQTLTTFVPTTPMPPTIIGTNECGEMISNLHIQYNASPSIETVAITTVPANMPPPTLNSPKHFFAPLKPRLKINTSLANKQLVPAGPPVIPLPPTTTAHQNYDPPDLYVTNGLATPYQRPTTVSSTSATTNHSTPPPLPQRTKSPQVSPCHRQRHQKHHHHTLQQHQQHQQHYQQQQQSQPTSAAAPVNVADVVAGTDVFGHTVEISETPNNINRLQLQQVTTALQQQQSSQKIEKPNILFTKINEPIYATAQKSSNILISATALTKPLMTATTNTTKSATTTASTNLSSTATVMTKMIPTTMDSIVQTDSVNLESILNDIETISGDILAIQLHKNKSQENMSITSEPPSNQTSNNGNNNKPLQQDDKSKKPYRSEMNLLLTYDGTNSTTPAITAVAASVQQQGRTRSLEREHTDSPSPNVPDPMAPFPENRTYIGFDQLNKAAGAVTTAMNVHLQKPPLPPSQLAATVVGGGISKPVTPPKPPPPVPPARMYPPPLNIRCAGMARAAPTAMPQQSSNEKALIPSSPVHGLEPNKSHLFAAIAHAAAKRAQFRNMSTELTRSLDGEIILGGGGDEVNHLESPAGETGSDEDTKTADAARRKARRVSIVCGDTNSPTTPDNTNSQLHYQGQSNNFSIGTPGISTATTNPATASCSDIASALAHHALRSLRQTSHSTPNSPHSTRRSNSNNMTESSLTVPQSSPNISAGGTPHHQTHGAGHSHHSHTNSNCSALANALQRKNSQDSIRGNSADLAAAVAIVARSKCSRRHSDGTVASNVQRISGGGSSGAGGAHHHHHHQHQSLLSNNPHHSHHSHQDSNQETGTSLSDRNSNSLASSRESSTSFSMRSQRRKISVSSHTGGKIPWCGCWGNGCL